MPDGVIPVFRWMLKRAKCVLHGHQWRPWIERGVVDFWGNRCEKCGKETVDGHRFGSQRTRMKDATRTAD
jgi:hypothetical protein